MAKAGPVKGPKKEPKKKPKTSDAEKEFNAKGLADLEQGKFSRESMVMNGMGALLELLMTGDHTPDRAGDKKRAELLRKFTTFGK